MDVKFLRDSSIPPSTLGQKISHVGSRGVDMGSWAKVMQNLDAQLDLYSDSRDGVGMLIIGGRKSICKTLLKLSVAFPRAKFHNSKGYNPNPLVVDCFSEDRAFGKNRTIIQVRGLRPYGADGGKTLRVGLFTDTNVAYEAELHDIAAMLIQHWGLQLKEL